MKTTGKWHIDRYPWKRGDEYMWYDEWTATMTATAMADREMETETTATATAMDWWCRSWSHRLLSVGVRTER